MAGELFAELHMLRLAAKRFPNAGRVTDFNDNDTARGAAEKGSSRSDWLNQMAQSINTLAANQSWALRTLRVASLENQLADWLSRDGVESIARIKEFARAHDLRLDFAHITDWSELRRL